VIFHTTNIPTTRRRRPVASTYTQREGRDVQHYGHFINERYVYAAPFEGTFINLLKGKLSDYKQKRCNRSGKAAAT